MNQRLKIGKLNNLQKPLSSRSAEWVKRHLNDPFVKKATKDGYICRAAYKLLEVQARFHLINANHNIVELGSAPGGWSQVLSRLLDDDGKIFAIDLQDMGFTHEKIDFIKGNFIEDFAQIVDNIALAGGVHIHGVISDMSPACSGDSQVDHWRIMDLCHEALQFAKNILVNNGYFVAKIFLGEDAKGFMKILQEDFKKVSFFKPQSSRKDSSEMYIVARNFSKK